MARIRKYGMAGKYGIPRGLVQKLNKAVERTIKEAMTIIAEEVHEIYADVIRQFYSHYSPKYYNRTFSTFSAINLYGRQYEKYIKVSKTEGVLGIQISDFYIKGDPYRAEKNWVFERTFAEGIHGFVGHYYDHIDTGTMSTHGIINPNTHHITHSQNIPQMQPAPKEVFEGRLEIYKHSNRKGIKTLQNTTQSVLNKYLKKAMQ